MDYVNCTLECSSTNCLVECGRVLNECNTGCPCELGCPNGCADCRNPICVCGDQSTPQNDENLKTCIGQNSIELGQCILDCDENETCEAGCIKNFKNHHKNCPCEVIILSPKPLPRWLYHPQGRVPARLIIGLQKRVPNNSFDFLSHQLSLVGALERVLSLRRKSRIFANTISKSSQYSSMARISPDHSSFLIPCV